MWHVSVWKQRVHQWSVHSCQAGHQPALKKDYRTLWDHSKNREWEYVTHQWFTSKVPWCWVRWSEGGLEQAPVLLLSLSSNCWTQHCMVAQAFDQFGSMASAVSPPSLLPSHSLAFYRVKEPGKHWNCKQQPKQTAVSSTVSWPQLPTTAAQGLQGGQLTPSFPARPSTKAQREYSRTHVVNLQHCLTAKFSCQREILKLVSGQACSYTAVVRKLKDEL